jgi:hypothetical protein
VVELAAMWLRSCKVAEPELEAERFANISNDLWFRDTGTTPLLATIAIIIYITNCEQFPRTTPELYEQFVDYLLNGRQNRVQTRANLRQLFGVFGAHAEQLAEWFYERRRELCTHVAYARLSGDKSSIISIAGSWLDEHAPESPPIYGRDKHLESVLTDTGLFIPEGRGITFGHKTVAEYLAAPLAGLPGPIHESRMWAQRECDEG